MEDETMSDAASEFKAIMDGTTLNYEIDNDGDACLVFDISYGRTQMVWVTGHTESYGDSAYRHVFSFIAKVDRLPKSADLYIELLKLVNKKKMGGLAIGGDRLLYRVDVAVSEGSAGIRDAVRFATMVADELEKVLTNGGDDY
jgi:hypothetical protein